MASRESANFVLVAAQLNVSAVQQLWLLENNVLERDDFADSLFTPMAVRVKSPRLELLILPDRVQVSAPEAEAQKTITQVVTAFVRSVQNAIFLAAGMNFVFWHDVDAAQMHEVTRMLWLGSENPLAKEFSGSDSQFGFYASRDVLDCRLKADLKPAHRMDGGQNGIIFSLNFHKDLTPAQSQLKDIESLVRSWSRADELAKRIVDAVAERTKAHA